VATRTLAVCLIAIISWFANEVWSKQGQTDKTNTEQNISIKVLQENIISIEKAVLRMEDSLSNDRLHRRKQDSILMDVAIKVNLMFQGR